MRPTNRWNGAGVPAEACSAVPAALAQGKLDCGQAYKGFWDKLEREKYAKISRQQLAGVRAWLLRTYDQAGDDQDARALFDRLNRMKF